MSFNLICALLITVAYVQAASVVKRQVGLPLSNEDPMEPAELGDRGVTLQSMSNLPLGAQANAMRALLRSQASATPNPMEDFGEPSEFGDGGVTYPNQPAAAPQTPMRAAGQLPPNFFAMMEAFFATMRGQQVPMPPPGGAQQSRTPVIDMPPPNPVPVNPAPVNPAPVNPAPVNPAPVNPAPVNPAAPVPPVGTAPQGAPAAAGAGNPAPNPAPNPGQSAVYVVPGQPFSGTV